MRTRLVRAAVATAALAAALSPLGTTAAPVCADEGRRSRPDGWVSLNRPAWSIGEHKVTAWASSPMIEGYLLATNGSTIARSTDGGCGWEEVYTPGIGVGENRLVTVGESIYDVAMPPSPPGRLPYISYAVVSDLDSTIVVTSSNLGETWVEQPSIGLPPIVQLHSVHVSADPRTAYVLVDAQTSLTAFVETTLYVTRDAGLTFTPVKRGLDASQYTEIAVDPVIPSEVWAWDAARLFHSKDSGTTFTEVRGTGGPISTVAITRYPAFAPAKVTAYRKDAALARRSTDGGVTWQTVPTKGPVTGAANLYSLNATATASRAGVFVDVSLFKIQGRDVTPRNLVLHDLAFQIGAGLITLYGSSGKDLYLRRFTPTLDPLPPMVDLKAPKIRKQGPTALLPADEVVKLVPGERRTIDYRLDLSPVPTKLDVFFAMDSTGSMSPVIASLRKDLQDIIDDLGRSGINVWFGVGDFKDYPHFGAGTDHPYKRFRAVGPINDELEDAINNITTGGGNGLDSALTATYQAATGEGQRVSDVLGDKGGWWVEPGQGAEWREDALKVLVIASDVRSRDPQNDPGYPGPTYRQVINALNHLGIEHVGLAVGNYPDEPYQALKRVSSGTSTLAPADGTDCDDDGKVDVLPYQPMVCKLPVNSSEGTNLAPAMVGLLESLEDRQTVSFGLSGDRRVAAVDGLSQAMGVNVKAYNTLDFAVEVRCDLVTSGETYRYGVEAKVAGVTVAATGLTVECAGVTAARRPKPEIREYAAPPVVRALVAAAAPPPPAPPAPVPQPQPQSNPNPNPQPGAQVQAGMAHQEQAEVQLALAEVDVREEDELAMVGVADTDAAKAGAVLCTGLAMSAGFAVAMRRRTRTAVVRVRSSG